MVRRSVTVINKLGLHLRAAAALVQTASGFESEIRIRRDTIEVDAKSIMAVLGLEAAKGSELVVIAEGPDEDDALRAVVGLVEAKFNEEE
jgi:phosphocarrier protein HPr